MNPAVLYALLSLLFAGINDLVFKRYAVKARSRGTVIALIGMVWAVLQSLLSPPVGGWSGFTDEDLLFGVGAGVALTLSNLLLIESLSHIEVSLGSTLYRLNTLGVVVLSVWFLQETLSPLQAAGIGFGILAVFLLLQTNQGLSHDRSFRQFLGLAILASLLRAAYGVLTKAGLNQGADGGRMLLIAAACWIVGGVAYALIREEGFHPHTKPLLYGLVSGVLVTLIVNFLVTAMSYADASLVIPIANLSFVAALILSLMLGWERLSGRKLTAIGLAVLSILLLAR
ncbi:MAG: DMT family transporter [Candidatus Thiodiazotropha sp.]